MLCALPGVEANVEDLMSAMQAIPQEAWPMFVSQLPAEVVRALGEFEAGSRWQSLSKRSWLASR